MRAAPRPSLASSTDLIAARLAALPTTGGDAELVRALRALVPHVHAAVRELRPSRESLGATLGFLTEVGQASDARRQEWVLLADLLGVSALLEELDGPRPRGATPNAPRGPFHRDDAPERAAGADLSLDGVGEPLEVRLRVLDLDGVPIADARVETWQANAEGLFENQAPDAQPEFNLRGRFRTDADGAVHWRTVRPGGYRVPSDGPVGALLERVGYPLVRPAHLHLRVDAERFQTLVTQLYDGSDPHLDADPLCSVRPELVVAFEPGADGRCTLVHDVVLARSS